MRSEGGCWWISDAKDSCWAGMRGRGLFFVGSLPSPNFYELERANVPDTRVLLPVAAQLFCFVALGNDCSREFTGQMARTLAFLAITYPDMRRRIVRCVRGV